jgi:hypothetical protein
MTNLTAELLLPHLYPGASWPEDFRLGHGPDGNIGVITLQPSYVLNRLLNGHRCLPEPSLRGCSDYVSGQFGVDLSVVLSQAYADAYRWMAGALRDRRETYESFDAGSPAMFWTWAGLSATEFANQANGRKDAALLWLRVPPGRLFLSSYQRWVSMLVRLGASYGAARLELGGNELCLPPTDEDLELTFAECDEPDQQAVCSHLDPTDLVSYLYPREGPAGT